jgi:hypothetical protein
MGNFYRLAMRHVPSGWRQAVPTTCSDLPSMVTVWVKSRQSILSRDLYVFVGVKAPEWPLSGLVQVEVRPLGARSRLDCAVRSA